MLYMVTFTINIPQMLAYIPYMDPMGYRLLSTRIMNIVDPIFHGYPKAPRRTPHPRRSSCSSQGFLGETCMNNLRLSGWWF